MANIQKETVAEASSSIKEVANIQKESLTEQTASVKKMASIQKESVQYGSIHKLKMLQMKQISMTETFEHNKRILQIQKEHAWRSNDKMELAALKHKEAKLEQAHLKSMKNIKSEQVAAAKAKTGGIPKTAEVHGLNKTPPVPGGGKVPETPGSKPGMADTMMKGAKAMFIMAAAVLVLAVAMIVFSYVPWESVAKGLITLGVLTAAVYLLGKNEAQSTVGATVIMALAASVGILAISMLLFTKVSWTAVAMGLFTLWSLVAAVTALGGAAPITLIGAQVILMLGAAMLMVAGSFVVFGYGIEIFKQSIKSLASLSWETMLNGLAMLGVVMVSLAIMAPFMLIAALGLVPLGIGLLFLGLGLILINMLGPKIGTTLKSIAGGLSDMGKVMLERAGDLLVGGVVLIVFGTGLIIISMALALFALVGMKGITVFKAFTDALVYFDKNIGWLTLGFAAAAGVSLAIFGAGLIVLGAAFIMFGIAGVGAVAAFTSMVPALQTFVENIYKFAKDNKEAFELVGESIGYIGKPIRDLGSGIAAFSKVNDNAQTQLTKAGKTIYDFVKSLGTDLDGLEDAGESLAQIGTPIKDLGLGMQAFGQVTPAGSAAMVGATKAIKDFISGLDDDMLEAMEEAGEQMKDFGPAIAGLGTGLKAFNEVGPNAGKIFASVAVDIKSFVNQFDDVAIAQVKKVGDSLAAIANPIESLGKGMVEFGKVTKNGTNMFATMATILKDFAKTLGGDVESLTNVGDGLKNIAAPLEGIGKAFQTISQIKGSNLSATVKNITGALTDLVDWASGGKDGAGKKFDPAIFTTLGTGLGAISDPLSKIGEALNKSGAGDGGTKIINTLQSLIDMNPQFEKLAGKEGTINKLAESLKTLGDVFGTNAAAGDKAGGGMGKMPDLKKLMGGMPSMPGGQKMPDIPDMSGGQDKSAEVKPQNAIPSILTALLALGDAVEKLKNSSIVLEATAASLLLLAATDKPFTIAVTNIDNMLTGLITFAKPLDMLALSFLKVADAMRSFGNSIELDRIDEIYNKWGKILSMENSPVLMNILKSGQDLEAVKNGAKIPAGDWATRRQTLDGGTKATAEMSDSEAAKATAEATMFLAEKVTEIKDMLAFGVKMDLDTQKLLFNLNNHQ
jgi:hypothetical protein